MKRLMLPALVACGPGIQPAKVDTGSTATTTSSSMSSTSTVPTSTTNTTVSTTLSTTPGGWSHNITIDGDLSDWTQDELFVIDGGTAHITWDADSLFVGVSHLDLVTGGSNHWVLIYVGNGQDGATDGVTFNTQQPALAFPVRHLVRWQVSDTWNSLLTWSTNEWIETPLWLGSGGNGYAEDEANQAVEFQLSRALLGLNDRAVVHINLLYEGAGFESSYAPSPTTSFATGTYDPDYGAFWDFDLTSSIAPINAPTVP